MRPRAEHGIYLMLAICQRFVGWRRAAEHFNGGGARSQTVRPLQRIPRYGARKTCPARHLHPRAEHGLYSMLPLCQRFAGWRRAAEHFSQRSTAAAFKRYASVDLLQTRARARAYVFPR